MCFGESSGYTGYDTPWTIRKVHKIHFQNSNPMSKRTKIDSIYLHKVVVDFRSSDSDASKYILIEKTQKGPDRMINTFEKSK